MDHVFKNVLALIRNVTVEEIWFPSRRKFPAVNLNYDFGFVMSNLNDYKSRYLFDLSDIFIAN